MLIGIAVGVLIEKAIKVYEERTVLTALEQEWSTRCNYYRKELLIELNVILIIVALIALNILIDILFVILVAHSSYSKPHCEDCDGDCAHCKFYGGE